jgi:LPXTG-motif cell wall-anchored protein
MGADELPQTASPLALLALLGIGAGGSAYGLRRFRRS